MHAHNTRLNAATINFLTERQQRKNIVTPEASEAIASIQADLNEVEKHRSDSKEKMIIATRIFKKMIESAPHLMWQRPRFKDVVQGKVSEFMADHRNNVYKKIDAQTRKEFTEVLFKMQTMC